MIADMHRARHLAWELSKLGWDAEILCPDSSYQRPSCIDGDSLPFFSSTVATHYVPPYHPIAFSALTLRSVSWRAFVPMLRVGRQLLQSGRFDLVYISTTQFAFFLLGPAWRRQFGIPFVLDFHDPCYRVGLARPIWSRPSAKHRISQWLSKYVESQATIAASGLISVSQHYVDILRRRYERRSPDWLAADRHMVIPFAALQRDLDEAAARLAPAAPKTAGSARIVYVGAGGPIMRRSFSLLCRALSLLHMQHPKLVEGVNIELYGTMSGWQEGDPNHLADLAREHGMADFVKENPNWISYRRSLELLLGSDGALVLGVDDAGYMPSKLFTYALSGKPLLASLRKEGPAFAQFQSTACLGHALWFEQSSEMALVDAANIVKLFLQEVLNRHKFDRSRMLVPYLATAMARRHVELFEACLQQ
jgi:glycosyltransferase involved in cell wall biosynthesis